MKRFVTALLLILVLIFSFTGCAESNSAKLYDPSNHDIRFFNGLTKEDIPTGNSSSAKVNYKSISTLSENPMYDDFKESLESFFIEVYDLDVSKKLSLLTTYEYNRPEENAWGQFVPDDKVNMYINIGKEGSSKNAYHYVWVHEAIHYLGFYSNKDYMTMLFEAADDAVTNQYIAWKKLDFNPDFLGYPPIRNFLSQMILVNPDLVPNQINGTESIDDNIENVLKDAVYPFDSPEPFKISEFYSILLEVVFNTFGEDYTTNVYAQEITTAYCRTFDPNDKQTRALRKLYYLDSFENISITR